MRKLIAVILLVLGTSSVSMAASWTVSVPEIDPTSSMAAMALLAGAVLVIRGRRKK